MRVTVYRCLSVSTCFNSKRCDYESLQHKIWHTDSVVSIPKGAIMSSARFEVDNHFAMFQFQKVRLWASSLSVSCSSIICFNSKRCDYERPRVCIYCNFNEVSIPKGAIMRIHLVDNSSIGGRVSIPKGAIMRYLSPTAGNSDAVFQFQKVRLWAG